MRKLTILALLFLLAGPAWGDSLEKAAKKISAGAKKLSNRRVAVLPFPYHDGRASKGSTIISERMTTWLVQQKKMDVIERSLLDNVFKELKLQATGAVDGETAKKIGKLLGVEAVINGTLIDLDEDMTEVNARLILLETGQIIVAAGAEVKRQWEDASLYVPMPMPAQEIPAGGTISGKAGGMVSPQPMMLSNRDPQTPEMMDEGPGFNQLPEDAFLIESDFTSETVRTPFGQEFVRGMRLLRSGNARAAGETFTKMLEKAEGNPSREGVVKLGLSASLFAQGNKARAVRLAREVAGQDEFPRMRSVARYVLGKYYESDGNQAAARELFMDVIRDSPFQTRLTRSAGQRIKAMNWSPKDDRRRLKAVRRELRRPSRR